MSSIEILIMLIGVLLGIIGWFSNTTLKGIQTSIKETNSTLKSLESDFRGSFADLDRRVVRIEARCAFRHPEDTE